MENKLSSARALHAELGAGLVRVHVHVVHSRVTRYKVGGYLKQKLHDGSPLKQEQHHLLPGNFKLAKWRTQVIKIYICIMVP